MREMVLECVSHATVTAQECTQQVIPVASFLLSLAEGSTTQYLQFDKVVAPVFILFDAYGHRLGVHLSSSNCGHPFPPAIASYPVPCVGLGTRLHQPY